MAGSIPSADLTPRPGEVESGEHASDLIVLAWRGAWDAGRAATIKSVVSHAGCPVMIVPAKHA